MKDNILVSFVVGIYNGEKYLNKCIDSIIHQDYKNIEIILVDDGSTDNSGIICDDYAKKDKRIKVIHKENGGVSSARNAGLKLIRGEYLCIMDQDDWIEKDYVSYLLNLALNSNSDIAIVPNVIVSTETYDNYPNIQKQNEIWLGEEAACQMLYENVMIAPWNKIIKKELIDKNKIMFNENFFGGEGYVFSIDCFLASNRVAVGYKGIYHYRIDNYSSEMSKFRLRTAQSSFAAVDLMSNKYKGKSLKLDKALDFAYWNVYYAYLHSMLVCNEKKHYLSEYKEWHTIIKKNFPIVKVVPISKKKKIYGYILTYFPNLYLLLYKIKHIFRNKGRDYSKAN